MSDPRKELHGELPKDGVTSKEFTACCPVSGESGQSILGYNSKRENKFRQTADKWKMIGNLLIYIICTSLRKIHYNFP